ncbi:MAG: hypothetical protein A3G34_09385 [Candidatus Lindowbacteria bacterium RIFCSPLOWO2_12_FULL_62_27]|nr:MAG: hypothetical protein A3I06_08050 [Candidatus Lindowbacteria bacterium RIFCSPLOWO2_02_FULL_62_12]OGH60249.1 MAG: hypothetical protein A3G34_09385 [Candidatus Lindowbacteria bacterium RIFCSPLOWO2_12_FULL_62_27]
MARAFLTAVFILGCVIVMPVSASMTQKTMPNGMRILAVEDHAQPAVILRVLLPRGENDDPAGLAGVSDLAAELALKGAGDRDADALAELVDEHGMELVGESYAEYTILGCNALSAHFDTAISILRDVVRAPLLHKKEFDLLKDQAVAGIKAQRSSPSYLAAISLPPAVFGLDLPQGRVKTEKSVQAIQVEDIRKFHQQCVQGAGAIALCIGDIDAPAAAEQLEHAFRDIPPGTPPTLPADIPKNRAPGQVIEVEKEGLSQTTVLIGKPGLGRLSAQYYSTMVANYVLGAGGFVSRLMAAVRAKEGKTYGIRSAIASSATPDLFDIKFSTRNEELIPSLKLTMEVMKAYANEGPTDTEVAEAKEFYKGYFFLQTETPGQRAAKMLVFLFYGLGLEEMDKYPGKIDAVTRASAHAAAREFLTADGLTYCLVGPKPAIREAGEYLRQKP